MYERQVRANKSSSHLMGDQAGVENEPLILPTSLSSSSFNSWYSFTSVRDGTATYRWLEDIQGLVQGYSGFTSRIFMVYFKDIYGLVQGYSGFTSRIFRV